MQLNPSDPRYRSIRAVAAQHADPAYWDEHPDASAAVPAAEGAKDLGDKVADIIESRMGKPPASGHAPAPASPPKAAPARAKSTGKDMGDEVCRILLGDDSK